MSGEKLTVCLCNLGPPWFISDKMTPEQFIAWPASGDVKLRCPADGERPLKYRWLKDRKPITYRRLDPKYVSERLCSDNLHGILYKCTELHVVLSLNKTSSFRARGS